MVYMSVLVFFDHLDDSNATSIENSISQFSFSGACMDKEPAVFEPVLCFTSTCLWTVCLYRTKLIWDILEISKICFLEIAISWQWFQFVYNIVAITSDI